MRQQRNQRGATAIEYAILVAALVIPLNSLIGSFQSGQTDHIQQSAQRVGMPEEFASSVTTGSTPVVTSGTDSSVPSEAEASVSITGTAKTQGTKRWTATIAIQVVNEVGAPILDADVNGTWFTTFADGSTASEAGQCVSDSAGNCGLTLSGLRRLSQANAATSVSFVIDTVTASDTTAASGVSGTTFTIAGV